MKCNLSELRQDHREELDRIQSGHAAELDRLREDHRQRLDDLRRELTESRAQLDKLRQELTEERQHSRAQSDTLAQLADKARDDQLRLLQEENELLRQRVAQLRQSIEAPEELHSAHSRGARWFDR